MINRLKDRFDEPEESEPEQDFHVVACVFEEFYVTREEAERILRELDARTPPRWIRFTDVNGSRISVRSVRIDHVQEWTATQRASDRAFRRARRREEKADRRLWDDD
jgi:hypothetical protein